MRVWRVASARYPAFDGEGERLWGGRWNTPGTPVVYASATVSLAVLEKLVWADPEEMPDDLVLHEIALPADARRERLAPPDLPPQWTEPLAPACVELGDRWLQCARALALLVPSAVLPAGAEEVNVLINPRHPAAPRVQVLSAQPFRFDLRLLR